MKRIVLGALALLVVGGGYLGWRNAKRTEAPKLSETVNMVTPEEERVNRFLEERGLVLPANVERANLGGVNEQDTGVATRETQGTGTLVTILAQLEDLSEGGYYGWYGSNGTYVQLGKLTPAKGGYLLETTVPAAKNTVGEIVVSQETAVKATPTRIVLRGNF